MLPILIFSIAAQVVAARNADGTYSAWMRQFTILTALTVPPSLLALSAPAPGVRIVAVSIVALIVSIASIPFGDASGMRVSLILLLAVVSASIGNVTTISMVMAFHAIWIVAMQNVQTPWNDAPGGTDASITIALVTTLFVVTVLFLREITTTHASSRSRVHICYLENTVRTLSEANVGYSTFARIARHQALLEERNRITREIHDDIGYTLTNIIMLSEATIFAVRSGKRMKLESLEAIRQQAKTGLYETRRSLRLMRQTEDGFPRGLDALRELLEVFEKATGVQATIEVLARRNHVEDPSLFLTLYRFVQESLTNAFRHGKASKVTLRLFEEGDWLHATVRDNGIGAAKVEEGIGLQGMRERITFLGGEVHYHQDHGFIVTATIPLRVVEHEIPN